MKRMLALCGAALIVSASTGCTWHRPAPAYTAAPAYAPAPVYAPTTGYAPTTTVPVCPPNPCYPQ